MGPVIEWINRNSLSFRIMHDGRTKGHLDGFLPQNVRRRLLPTVNDSNAG